MGASLKELAERSAPGAIALLLEAVHGAGGLVDSRVAAAILDEPLVRTLADRFTTEVGAGDWWDPALGPEAREDRWVTWLLLELRRMLPNGGVQFSLGYEAEMVHAIVTAPDGSVTAFRVKHHPERKYPWRIHSWSRIEVPEGVEPDAPGR